MSNAWECTPDDILNVIHKMGRKATSEQVEDIMNRLDHIEIENAALQANDLETQTEYAYQEMEKQIRSFSATKYTIPQYGITVEVSPAGGGNIQSGLSETLRGTEPALLTDPQLEGAIHALESLILAHACAGINIQAPEYVAGLTTALAAIADNL